VNPLSPMARSARCSSQSLDCSFTDGGPSSRPYWGGVTTVVVVELEAGGATGSVTVVVRLTVVVVVVGGGVETTSSLVQAPKLAATPTVKSIRSSVFICANKFRNRGLRRI
jgi:hypothetical protein